MKHWLRYILALLAILALTFVKLHWPALGSESPFLFYTLVTSAVAFYGGAGPGIVSLLLSALLGNYFFLPPAGISLTGAALIKTMAFMVQAGIIVWLVETRRIALKRAEQRRDDLKAAKQNLSDAVLGKR